MNTRQASIMGWLTILTSAGIAALIVSPLMAVGFVIGAVVTSLSAVVVAMDEDEEE